MNQIQKGTGRRSIRIAYEKIGKEGSEKKEIILIGYNGLVMIVMTILIGSGILIISGVKLF